ncbi:MAG: DUF3301 domain-containing protein [Steroidobacteraceae bacterium]
MIDQEPLVGLILAALTLAIAYKSWRDAMDARELANRVARDACSRAVVQLLDGTVAFAGWSWRGNARGHRKLRRTYTFDYSRDGFEREQGFVVLAGLRVESVGISGPAA